MSLLLFITSIHALCALQPNATLTNREVPNSSADPANKAKLILLLGGFNNTGELESQLKRISMPPISSQPLHALMIMECHQHSYTVQWISFDMRIHTRAHKETRIIVQKSLHTYTTVCVPTHNANIYFTYAYTFYLNVFTIYKLLVYT